MLNIFCFVLLILLGAFMFVYGEADDSPGGQLIGLIAIVAGAVALFKSIRKTHKE
jgi:hypothetical protein